MWSFVCIRTSGLSNRDSNRESNRQWGIDCLIGLDGYSFLTIGLRRSNSPGDDGLIIGSNSVQGSTDRFCWIQIWDFQIWLVHVQLGVSSWSRSGSVLDFSKFPVNWFWSVDPRFCWWTRFQRSGLRNPLAILNILYLTILIRVFMKSFQWSMRRTEKTYYESHQNFPMINYSFLCNNDLIFKSLI